MAANDVLMNAEKVIFYAQCQLDNTLTLPASYNMQPAGLIPVGTVDNTIEQQTNSFVNFSNDQVLNGETSEIMIGGVELSKEMPEPFSDSSSAVVVGNLRLANIDSSDEIRFRKFKSTPVTISVGGLLHKGKPNEQLLTESSYEPYILGRFNNKSSTERELDHSIQLNSGELQFPYPSRVYDFGQSEGLAKPYIFGRVFGYKPAPINDSLYQFHDGIVEHSDSLFTDLPFYSFADGVESPDSADFLYSGAASGSPSVTQVTSDFDFTQTSSQRVDAATYSTFATTNSPNVELVANGNSFNVVASSSAPSANYNGDSFQWRKVSDTRIESITSPKITVDLTGDVRVADVAGVDPNYGSQWFKINALGSGSVTITCEEVFVDADMVIRSVLQGAQLVDNFNFAGAPTNPSLPVDLSAATASQPSVTNNHVINFSNINSKTISFDYEATTDVLFTAIWFQNIRISRPLNASVDIEFDRVVENAHFNFTSPLRQAALLRGSSPNSTIENSNGLVRVDMSNDGRSYRLNLDLSAGDANVEIGLVEESLDQFGGVIADGVITLCPPPEYVISGTSFKGESTIRLPSATRRASTMLFRARAVSDLDTEFRIFINNSFIKVLGNTFQEYSVRVPAGTNSQTITAYRGGFDFATPSGFINVANPDVEHCIEIDQISISENRPIEASIRVYDSNSSIRQELAVYRVNDCTKFPNLPVQTCLYDERGFLSVNESSSSIEGDFIGSDVDILSIDAFRQISLGAAGEDYITSSISGRRVGFVIDQQKPWVQHIRERCSGLDYLEDQNAGSTGTTIRERWDGATYPSDFRFTFDDIVEGSVRDVNNQLQQYRYYIEYQQDLSDSNRSKYKKSQIGHLGDVEEKRIVTDFYNESDAELMASRIIRDSSDNDIKTLSIKGVGHGLELGMVGTFDHPKIQARKACEILQWKHSENRTTFLKIKVYT